MGMFGRPGLCTGFRSAFRPEPRPAITGDALWNAPWLFAGDALRLITGRASVRCGGIAADLPAFPPSIVVRVGLASTVCTGLTRPSSFGEILTALRATGCEFTNALRETAVNPLGTCIFA